MTETSQHRITFGDDGSQGADIAWGWIAAQQWPGWAIDVVTVEAPAPSMAALFTYEPLREYAPADPRVVADRTGIVGVRHLTTRFDPRAVLADVADTDLIVVGARGGGAVRALNVGSTAEHLLHEAAAPVVVARQARVVSRALACVDGSAHAHRAVEVLAGMPWISDAEVTVLSIEETGNSNREPIDEAGALLESAGARVRVEVIQPDPMAVFLNPRDTIVQTVQRRDPDLVVLGTRGRTGLAWVMLGSVARAVAHHVDCPVLLAQAP